MRIVTGHRIGLAIPLKGKADDHRRIALRHRLHGQMKDHGGVAAQITRIDQGMVVIARGGTGLAVPLEGLAGQGRGIAIEHRKDRQVQHHNGVVPQATAILNDMGVVACGSTGLTVPFERLADDGRRVTRQRGQHRQMQHHGGVATQIAALRESMWIVAGFGIGLAIPLKRKADDHRRVARQHRLDGQMEHHGGVAAQVAPLGKGVQIVARHGIGFAVPFKRLAGQRRGIAHERRHDGQMQYRSGVAAQVTPIREGMGIVTRGGTGLSVPFEGLTGDHRRVAGKHRKHRQMEHDDGVTRQVAPIREGMGIVTRDRIGLAVPFEGFAGDHRRVAGKHRKYRQMEHRSGVTAQVTPAGEGVGIVARLGIGLAIPLKGNAHDHAGVARQHRFHRQVKHHGRVAAEIARLREGMIIIA